MLSNWHDANEQLRREARLTAYALGQLDELERADAEAELAASKSAREAVKATCELAQARQETEAEAPRCTSSTQPESRWSLR